MKLYDEFHRDILDINYFIDHVGNVDARVDVLSKMGYKIGVNVVPMNSIGAKTMQVGKKNELRYQITDALKGLPLAKCVILRK